MKDGGPPASGNGASNLRPLPASSVSMPVVVASATYFGSPVLSSAPRETAIAASGAPNSWVSPTGTMYLDSLLTELTGGSVPATPCKTGVVGTDGTGGVNS